LLASMRWRSERKARAWVWKFRLSVSRFSMMRAPVMVGLERHAWSAAGLPGSGRMDGIGRCERIVLGAFENISGNSVGFAAHFGPRATGWQA